MARIIAGNRGRKGTLITKRQASAAAAEAIDNVIILEDNREKVAQAINRALAQAVEEIGQRAERHAKAKCPVDTGRLRNSITHVFEMEGDEPAVYVGTNVEYAPYVENGTHSRYGRKFLYQAATGHSDEYAGVVRKHMGNA